MTAFTSDAFTKYLTKFNKEQFYGRTLLSPDLIIKVVIFIFKKGSNK